MPKDMTIEMVIETRYDAQTIAVMTRTNLVADRTILDVYQQQSRQNLLKVSFPATKQTINTVIKEHIKQL